jgi:AraC-like DNA-binding protein
MAKAQCRTVPDSLPVDELAALASLSVSHFCRAFRQKFGERPYAYIVRLRLQGAQELMLSGRGSARSYPAHLHLCRPGAFRQGPPARTR